VSDKDQPARGSDGPFIEVNADLAKFYTKDSKDAPVVDDEKWGVVMEHMKGWRRR